MKSRKKRILGILFSLALMVGMIGAMSQPAYAKPSEYPLWVGGVQVTSANMSGEGWSYTPAIKEGDTTTPAKLVLNGYSYEGAGYEEAAIYAKEDLVIELTNDNSVTATSNGSYGIKVEDEDNEKFLVISGKGKLTATGGNDGIRTNGDIIIDSVSITASGRGQGIVAEPGVVRINGGTVTASGSMEENSYGTGIWGSEVKISSGTVTASGDYEGIYSANDVVITKDIVSVTAFSNDDDEFKNAINGTVKNAIAGTGWTNTAGTEGEEAIAVSGSDGQTLDYKKVQFLSADPVDVTLNYGSGHTSPFIEKEETLDQLKEAVGAKNVSMSAEDTTIILEGVPGSMTEAELRTILDGFVQDLKGEDEDWLIDSGELYAAVGYKPLDKYESMQEVADDIGEESTKHNVPITDETTYYLLWAKAVTNLQLDNGNPICGKETNAAKPTLPTGTQYYVDPEIPDDPGYEWYTEEEEFKGGEEYFCKVDIEIDPNGALWNKYFSEDLTTANVKGGEVVEIDADTPGLLLVTFKATADHDWDEGTETKKPTTTTEGEMTYRCKAPDCGATKTEAIPKLKASVQTAKVKAKGKRSLVIAWNKVPGADGYDIFFAKCNNNGKKIVCKKVKNIKGNNTFKWTKSGLKKGTSYKSYVKAYTMKDGKKKYISKSPIMHAYTGNVKGGYTNAKAVKVKKTRVTLNKGKTFKIKAKVTKVKKNKKLMPKKHVKTLRYRTSDKTVATVTKGGKIIAKGKGTCKVIVFAHNGVSKTIKVTVK